MSFDQFKLTRIKEFKLDDDQGCLVIWDVALEPLFYLKHTCVKVLQQGILSSFRYGNCFKACTPTHESA